MDPSSPDVKRPSRNLISTPGPNPIQSRSLYMTKDSACPLSSLMACTRSTGQEAGKINVHETKRSITGTERERETEWVRGTDGKRKRRKRKNVTRKARKPIRITELVKEKSGLCTRDWILESELRYERVNVHLSLSALVEKELHVYRLGFHISQWSVFCFSSPAEFGVDGEFAWLPWADTLVALTAVLAAYMLASSWNLPMFFLYRILLFPNQFDTWWNTAVKVKYWILTLNIPAWWLVIIF